jgi:hypothetical protein
MCVYFDTISLNTCIMFLWVIWFWNLGHLFSRFTKEKHKKARPTHIKFMVCWSWTLGYEYFKS